MQTPRQRRRARKVENRRRAAVERWLAAEREAAEAAETTETS